MTTSQAARPARRVVVVALDGACLSSLDRWLQAGRMPNLRQLVENGASGPLRSIVPPVTAPAWCSFMTGKNPGKHGVYYFTTRDEDGREVPVTAATRHGATLWEWLGDRGRRVVVLNVPVTYPPTPVNGVLVSGFLTPSGADDYVWPRELREPLEDRLGPYPLYLKTPVFAANLSAGNVRRFLAELRHEVDYKFAALQWLIDSQSPDLAVVHIWGTDRIQHELWNLFDEQHPSHDAKLGARFRGEIGDYFAAVDAELGRLAAEVDEDTALVVVSDHGFGPIHRFIDLNAWLLREGFIAIKRNPLSLLRKTLWSAGITNGLLLQLAQFPMRWGLRPPEKTPGEAVIMVGEGRWQPLLSFKDVDWKRTTAYSNLGMGQILINTTKRDPERGAVSSREEYERVRADLLERLAAIRDPETDELIGGDVFTKEQAYEGPFTDQAPDLVWLPIANKYIASVLTGFTFKRWVRDIPALFGNHRMDGLFVAAGGPFRAATHIEGSRLIDVFPTLSHLLGESVPDDIDGRVLTAAFTPSFAEQVPVRTSPASDGRSATPPELDPAEERDVIDRLRGLGYL